MKIIREYLGSAYYGEEPVKYEAVLHQKYKTISVPVKENGKTIFVKKRGRVATFSSLPDTEFIVVHTKELGRYEISECSTGLKCEDVCVSTYEKAFDYFINYSSFRSVALNDSEESKKRWNMILTQGCVRVEQWKKEAENA